MSKLKKNRVSPAARRPEDMPSLRAFWEELKQHCGTDGAPVSGGRMAGSAHGFCSGSQRSSQRGSQRGSYHGSGSRFGDGDDALGYGLGLIAPDLSAEERVQMILRTLVEKDAAREKQRKEISETRG